MLSQMAKFFRRCHWWKAKRRRWRSSSAPQLHSDSDFSSSASDLPHVEEQLKSMEKTTQRLLSKLSDAPDDPPTSPDDECVICVSSRATMATFPCGHRVLCRRCLVRTIQVAVAERQLPLRCVLCRSKISRLKHQNCGKALRVLRQSIPPPSSNPLGICAMSTVCS